MKKLLIIFFILSSVAFAQTYTQTDKYGNITGRYKVDGQWVYTYDKYGNKTGYAQKTSKGYNTYDKYGNKTGSVKPR